MLSKEDKNIYMKIIIAFRKSKLYCLINKTYSYTY